MTTIGIPGSKRGIQKEDPTLAEVLKSVGYSTAQFGKNHLGDRNEFLPTVHGFDEWFGNLYHLNAEEEPEELEEEVEAVLKEEKEEMLPGLRSLSKMEERSLAGVPSPSVKLRRVGESVE